MRVFARFALLLLLAPLGRAADLGTDLVDCKITLPNGDVYLRGESDPIAELVVKLTLTNKTAAEKRAKIDFTVTRATYLTEEEFKKFQAEEYPKNDAFLDKVKEVIEPKTTRTPLQVWPVNKESMGLAYVPPELGPHDLVEFVITRQPDEGQGAEAKPVRVARDMAVEHTDRMDYVPTAYLAAGETSPEFTLPAGRFYRVKDPGSYTIKAVLRGIGDSSKPEKVVESNEERFRVLPYKIVDRKLDSLTNWWEDFERGHPDFSYMFYQLNRNAPFDEIYYVQRLNVRGREQWEWHRLCSVAANGKVQVKQVSPTKVALLSPHEKGDAGLYTVDFSKTDPVVTCKILTPAAGQLPTLKVEGGTVTAE